MDASKIQAIIEQENTKREMEVANQARNLIKSITEAQNNIKGYQKNIESYRKQLKDLTVETLDAATIMEET